MTAIANITVDFVARTNKPGIYRDSKLKGFVLRVGQSKDRSGAMIKSYQVNGRIKGGTTIIHTIGKEGAPWTATTARARALEVLSLMKLGLDPREELKEEKQKLAQKQAQAQLEQQKSELTLRRVFEAWSTDQRNVKNSTKQLYRQVIFKHLHDWLDQPLLAVTSEMCVRRYDKIADETVASANNTFRALRMLFNWEIARQEDSGHERFLVSNPVSALSRRKRNKWRAIQPRTDVVADEDLKAWFDAVVQLPPKFRDYFLLVAVTAIRRDEALKLRWKKDVNFKARTFTCRDTKNGRDHCLPMTEFVYQLFLRRWEERENDDYVFASIRSKSGRVHDVRYWTQKLVKKSGVDFTSHALRRTFSFNASVLLSDANRKQVMNHMWKSDVTDAHYTPKVISILRESMEVTEARMFKLANIDPTSFIEAERPQRGSKVVTLR